MKTPMLILILCTGWAVSAFDSASAQSLAMGAAAPKFRLKDHEGKAQTFPPKSRWSVLAFYPRAMTGG